MVRGHLLLLCALGCSRAAPLSPAPAPTPTIASGVYKLIVSASHEISCSWSFERHDEDATYELTIGGDHRATLTATIRSAKVFGPSSSMFHSGPVNKTRKERKLRYIGRANDGTTFEGTEEHSAAVARLTCSVGIVVLTDAAASRVSVISCSGLPFMPEAGAKHFAGRAPLATGTGVMLSIDDHGHGSPGVTLRRGI